MGANMNGGSNILLRATLNNEIELKFFFFFFQKGGQLVASNPFEGREDL